MNKYKIMFLFIFMLSQFVFGLGQNENKAQENKYPETTLNIDSYYLVLDESIAVEDITTVNNYTFDLPDNAVGFEIRVECAEGDLDLFQNYDSTVDVDAEEYVNSSVSDRFDETIKTFRGGFEKQKVFFSVLLDSAGLIYEEPLELGALDYRVHITIFYPQLSKEVNLNEKIQATLDPLSLCFSMFPLKISADMDDLKVYLFGSGSDVDLYLFNGPDLISLLDTRESLFGIETMEIYPENYGPESEIYLAVYSSNDISTKQDFSLLISDKEEFPSDIVEFPDLFSIDDGYEGRYSPTVEIRTDDSSGSGTIISPSGLILTNYHVLENANGKITTSEIVVALQGANLAVPPQFLFKAVIVDLKAKEDLALLKIIGSYYDHPLPDNYAFRYSTIDRTLPKVGTSISIVGYPDYGGTNYGRQSLTVTKGIVSGYSKSDMGLSVKSDAIIGLGNSGGSVYNDKNSLIGIPSFYVSSENNSNLSYFIPVSNIDEWFKIIKD